MAPLSVPGKQIGPSPRGLAGCGEARSGTERHSPARGGTAQRSCGPPDRGSAKQPKRGWNSQAIGGQEPADQKRGGHADSLNARRLVRLLFAPYFGAPWSPCRKVGHLRGQPPAVASRKILVGMVFGKCFRNDSRGTEPVIDCKGLSGGGCKNRNLYLRVGRPNSVGRLS
jgi:hypothetical protein